MASSTSSFVVIWVVAPEKSLFKTGFVYSGAAIPEKLTVVSAKLGSGIGDGGILETLRSGRSNSAVKIKTGGVSFARAV